MCTARMANSNSTYVIAAFLCKFVTQHVFRGVRTWTKYLPHVRGLGSEGACVGLALAEIQRSPCALLIKKREQHAGESSEVSENSRSEQRGSSRWEGMWKTLQQFQLVVDTGFLVGWSKGSARRKKKIVHKTATDDKKLQNTLKRLGVNNIQSIEEVNMIKDDGHVLHFTNPKGTPRYISDPNSYLRFVSGSNNCVLLCSSSSSIPHCQHLCH